MADFQIEIEFELLGVTPDADLLERFADELDERASQWAAVPAIHGDRFSATLTVDAENGIDAARLGAEAVVGALEEALGDEIDVSSAPAMRRLLIEDAVLA